MREHLRAIAEERHNGQCYEPDTRFGASN
jgi:hypothetical protein